MRAAPKGGIDPQALEWSEVAAHLIALCGLPGIGPATLLRWHREVGAPTAWRTLLRGRTGEILALAGPRARLGEAAVPELVDAARATDPQRELERHAADGRRVLVEGTPGYPARLRDDPAPPAVLFAQGDPEVLDAPTVAIVGTRNATRAGRDLAAGWGAELAAAGVGVVSGLALGIDAAAHNGAVAASDRALGSTVETHVDPSVSGPTQAGPVAVVGGGVDAPGPSTNAALARRVVDVGAVLSEAPPGTRPAPWRFPVRNRILAALAPVVVVVESAERGGSMLTVEQAQLRDRTVLAVPGPVDSPASAGTNALISEGALVCRGADDVVSALGLSLEGVANSPVANRPEPDGDAASVLAVLGFTPVSIESLSRDLDLDLGRLSVALGRLEALGWAERRGPFVERVARSDGGPRR